MNDKYTKVFEIFEQIDPMPEVISVKIHDQAYTSLISVMLSAQTRDEKTVEASDNLFAVADTPEEILKLSEEEIKKLIKPVSFYNKKAVYILNMTKDLIKRFNGVVPDNRKDLMSLPGVGRKSSDIILRYVYGQPTIAVDTHVHRVAKRLGLVKTANADQTAAELEKNVPVELRYHAHDWLITHGKEVCKAVGVPLCGQCPFKELCDFYNKK
jgi:endonuclease III